MLFFVDRIYHRYADIRVIELYIELIDGSFADQRQLLADQFLYELDQRQDDLACHLILVLSIGRYRQLLIAYLFSDIIDEFLQYAYRSALGTEIV